MFRIENIEKTYSPLNIFEGLNWKKTPVKVLKKVSFTLEKNRIIALLGCNGAGKTTLLKILSGMLLPDGGDVLWDGKKLSENKEYFASHIGYIGPEDRSFYWRLTLYENMEFFCGFFEGHADREKILSVFRTLGIDQYRDTPFRMLSAGTKAKAQLARGLLWSDRFLILDEPFANIDIKSREEIKGFLKKWISEGERYMLITSHHIDELEDWIDEVFVLTDGFIMEPENEDVFKKQMVRVEYEEGDSEYLEYADLIMQGVKFKGRPKKIEIVKEGVTDVIRRLKDGSKKDI